MDKCPCTIDCPDRNAKCHMKGKCPHGYDVWAEANAIEREKRYEQRQIEHFWTEAKDKRHQKWIKNQSKKEKYNE